MTKLKTDIISYIFLGIMLFSTFEAFSLIKNYKYVPEPKITVIQINEKDLGQFLR